MSSNVHGVKKVKTNEELAQARKQKEAVKIKEYNDLVSRCKEEVEAKHFEFSTLRLTSDILQLNPDYYTIWNYRREILLQGIFPTMDEEAKQQVLQQELEFFMQLIRINPKSYSMWNHRRWCLSVMSKPDWQQEFKLVGKMLDLDARNFHGWSYRRNVVANIREQQADTKEIDTKEFEYTSTKIKQSFSNYSAWHYRSKVLPSILKDMTDEERTTVGKKELDLIKNALYTEPDDQSAWLYYWWLVGRVPSHVQILGAYSVSNTPSLFVVFDDEVQLAGDIAVQDEQNNNVNGSWYGVSSTTAHKPSSVWAFRPNDTGIAGKVSSLSLSKENVVADSPEKLFSTINDAITVTSLDDEALVSVIQQLDSSSLKATITTSPVEQSDQTETYTLWQKDDHELLLVGEIESLEELLDLEPDSKWVLQTLAHFMLQLEAFKKQNGSLVDGDKELRTKALEMVKRLSSIDRYRNKRYQDWIQNIESVPITSNLSDIKTEIKGRINSHLKAFGEKN
ncbi:hypothetical protein INT44_003781 [Umbelopsis vinacea]|uniref:Geranylgeranyl transferase type-2 subunit alpha n=1 Tax=Umbelopsis vinacea TaxID=44442 RepID=A0A8H7UIZ8_9FUNG|nr:hypothetical protein INT44_003781 [Umbelopsis vinacea]